jgi:hypothetical protein
MNDQPTDFSDQHGNQPPADQGIDKPTHTPLPNTSEAGTAGKSPSAMDEGHAGEDGKQGKKSRKARIHFILFCLMLILALIGMGITQATQGGGWEYWGFLVLFYGLISITVTWRQAKSRGEPIWRMIRKQVLHWAGALVAFKLLFLLERTDIVSREAASELSVILLALVCYLAGVHFQWMFMLIGLVVGIMALTLAYLEQYMVIGWIIVIPTALAATWLFLKFKRHGQGHESS